MSKILDCEGHDFNMYYTDTILIYNGEPTICRGAVGFHDDETGEYVYDSDYEVAISGDNEVYRHELSVKYLPPMY